MMQEERIWTVSEVNAAVREVLEGGFMPFWMSGELGTLNLHRSGHVYMTLKDERNQIRGVFFRGAQEARKLDLKVGDRVELFGQLTVYEVRGEYQILVKAIRPCGLGELQRRLAELQRKLAAEGLFDEARKKSIPLLPKKIGVVSSPGGAAIRDFLNIIQRRFPNLNIRIYPAPVQGEGAAAKLARGIEFFDRTRSVDVIVLTRGGGSLEDLWPFNEEVLARAIAECRIPLISAVGHEIDTSISDLVADLRVPTPSAAAELVVGRQEEFQDRIRESKRRLANSLELTVSRMRTRFERAALSYVFREPIHLVRQRQQQLDELIANAERSLLRTQERAENRLARAADRLKAMNPKAVLARGYAILTEKQSGKAILSPLPTGQQVHAILAEGEMELEVKNCS